MELEPGMESFIKLLTDDAMEIPPDATLDERRARFVTTCQRFDVPLPADMKVEDTVVASVGVRIYRPAGTTGGPAIVFFHGGGWMFGNLDSHHNIASGIAVESGVIVVAVDYRLAPEHPYPAALDDAFAVVAELARNGSRFGIDGARLALAGDSAGGNLAAAVALKARDDGGPVLRGQCLAYPALDPAMKLPSAEENANAPILTRAAMLNYWKAYLGGATESADPLAAPLLAQDLGNLPPAFITTAGRDPLHDDGRVYAERLRHAGVKVVYRNAPRAVHGHLRARFVSHDVATEFDAMCEWLQAAVA